MGYAATTIVIWGIQVNGNQARKMIALSHQCMSEYHDQQSCVITDECHHCGPFSKCTDPEKHDTVIKGKPWCHDFNINNDEDIDFFADGADSRIHSLHYDSEFDQFTFGIKYAANGYGCNDNIGKACQNVPLNVKEEWEKFCQPLLDKLRIQKKPDLQVINQTW